MSIIAIRPPMMHTGSGQMSEPPDEQKEHQEHAIQPIQPPHMTGFPIPATTFQILKGGLDPHAPTILGEPFASRRLIGKHEQGLLFPRLPTRAQIGLNLLLLPEADVPREALARLIH
jgi:hypothetical protein